MYSGAAHLRSTVYITRWVARRWHHDIAQLQSLRASGRLIPFHQCNTSRSDSASEKYGMIKW